MSDDKLVAVKEEQILQVIENQRILSDQMLRASNEILELTRRDLHIVRRLDALEAQVSQLTRGEV